MSGDEQARAGPKAIGGRMGREDAPGVMRSDEPLHPAASRQEVSGARTPPLEELHQFVVARLDERVDAADESGDDLDHAFALTSRRLVTRLGQDITERPWAHRELARFLRRSALRYRRHPDFEPDWMGDAKPDGR